MKVTPWYNQIQVISKHILESLKIICGHCGWSAKKKDFLKIIVNNILKFNDMKKKKLTLLFLVPEIGGETSPC